MTISKRKSVGKKKAPAKKAPAKKMPAAAKVKGEGYKGHRVGSRAEELHKFFDAKGAEKAKVKAQELGWADGTINTQFTKFRKA